MVSALLASVAVKLLTAVNPLVGSDGQGGTMPYAGVPFASAMWVPMTRESQFGRVAFDWNDGKLLGFASSRQMAIAMGEWGEFSFQPSVGEGVPDCNVTTRGLDIDRTKLTFTPYVTTMTAGGVMTDFTAFEHSAIYRMDFPGGASPRIVFDASRNGMFNRFPQTATNQSGGVSVKDDGRTLIGWNTDRTDWYRSRPLPNFKAHFRMEISETPTAFGMYERILDGGVTQMVVRASGTAVTADACGAYLVFRPSATNRTIFVKCGVSLIDANQCAANLHAEIPGWDFYAAETKVYEAWVKQFARLKVVPANDAVRTIFATALYHALQWPRDITEDGRYYSAYDDRVHEGTMYTGQSLWDTYRAENALLSLLVPERMDGMMQALVSMSKEGGWLPLYPNPAETSCMVGAPAEIELAEAYLKGFRGFDAEAAYAAVRHNATVPTPADAHCLWRDQEGWTGCPEGRGGLTTYQQLGYVACDRTCQAVSRTQDFSHADDAVSRFAAALGRRDDAAYFAARSHSWTNLWNTPAANVRPRDSAGAWVDPETLYIGGNRYDGAYSECSPDLARWSVPHDFGRLVELLGGKERTEALLDRFVEDAYKGYWGGVHSNEPAHHIPYLYNLLGCHDKCARTVKMIMEKCYRVPTRRDAGLHGHDDCGQMSAWYVFSALGFYPVNPVDLTYQIGFPMVDRAELSVGDGRTFRIRVENRTKDSTVVKSVRLNGRELGDRTLRHSDILAGGELVFGL